MKIRIIITILTVLFLSCHKDKSAPSSTPQSVSPSPQVKYNNFYAQINDSVKTDAYCMGCYGGSLDKQNHLRSTEFFLASLEDLGFTYSTKIKPGTYALSKSVYPTGIYYLKGLTYKSVSGTLQLSSVDTNQNDLLVSNLVGNFNFKTDTINGKSYAISGIIKINPH